MIFLFSCTSIGQLVLYTEPFIFIAPVGSSTAVQSQKAVSAYFTNKQIMPLGFAEPNGLDCD